jgi:hypothetical protein
MKTETHDALIEHLRAYLKTYTDRQCTIEAAAMNYVREFPLRLHLTIIALLEKADGKQR